MMNFQSFLLVYVSLTFFSVVNCAVRKLSEFENIFLEPSTKLFDVSDINLNLKANGIVVAIAPDGEYSTICVNHDGSFNQLAKIVCDRLGYNGSQASHILISSSGKSLSYKTKYKVTYCSSTDCDLQSNYRDSSCDLHEQDLHVFCTNSYSYTKTPSNEICKTNKSCTLEKGASKELTIVEGTNKYLMCGRNRNFQLDEAKLFCKLLGKPTAYSRIVESIGYKGKEIGGFTKMSCPTGASDLSECSNLDPKDREGCTPSDAISVVCSDINVLAPVVSPKLSCNSTWVTVSWNDPTITIENFNILYPNKSICVDVIKTMVKSYRIIEMKLNRCGMTKNGDDRNYLNYGFLAKRSYIKDNLVLKAEELFSLKCKLSRPTNSSEKPVQIGGSQINPGGGTIDLPTNLALYKDSSFTNKLSSVNQFAVGAKVFVLVNFVDPPSNIVLILLNCRVTISGNAYTLIENKCPKNTRRVEIIPKSRSSMGFSFESFTQPGADARVTCDTTKCVSGDTGCDQTCKA